jgi:uncharacterized membrane protein (DUF441 family)
LKKAALLLTLAVLAMLFDGTLSFDILDFRLESFSDWLGVFLVAIIIVTIAWSDSPKKDEHKNIQK